jgi:hypothetical protein
MSTELNLDSIVPGQLRGFMSVDRWMVQRSYTDLVLDYGPEYGMPRWYDMVTTAPFMPKQRIHHTRCVRMDGVGLPFRQRIAEDGWGMSVIERLYDRLLAFDSGTMGVAQLLFRAYIRSYKVKDYRQIVTTGGDLLEGFMRSMELMRMMQSNEGLTIIDSEDDFQTHPYNFGGLADDADGAGPADQRRAGHPAGAAVRPEPGRDELDGRERLAPVRQHDQRGAGGAAAAAAGARVRRAVALGTGHAAARQLGLRVPPHRAIERGREERDRPARCGDAWRSYIRAASSARTSR